MNGIQLRVKRYIYLEETQRAMENSVRSQAEKKLSSQQEDHQRKEA